MKHNHPTAVHGSVDAPIQRTTLRTHVRMHTSSFAMSTLRASTAHSADASTVFRSSTCSGRENTTSVCAVYRKPNKIARGFWGEVGELWNQCQPARLRAIAHDAFNPRRLSCNAGASCCAAHSCRGFPGNQLHDSHCNGADWCRAHSCGRRTFDSDGSVGDQSPA